MHGKCRLCLAEGVDLQDSHIIPQWAYKRLRDDDASGGDRNPIVVAKNIAVQVSNQISEYMLCKCCERRIAISEEYVAEFAYASDGSPVPLERLGVSSRESREPRDQYHVDTTALDVEKLVYFATSVVWRAAVAKRPDTGKPKLGAKYSELLRRYLLNEIDFPQSAGLTLSILDSAMPDAHLRLDNILTFPSTEKRGGCDAHRFYICGLYFELYTGEILPQYLRTMCLHHGREKYALLVDPKDFGPFSGISGMAQDAIQKGGLARRRPGAISDRSKS